MSNQEGLWVCWFDLHSPKIHKPTYDAAMDFIKHVPVRGFIFGGDQNDNSEISHHNHGKILFREPGAYKRNTEKIRTVLTEIEAALPADAVRVWIKGNHDDWERQLVETHPELQGTVERDKLLDLTGRGWKVIETGQEYALGKLSVIHGETLAGANHARKAVEVYGSSVLYGHFHGPQSYARVSPFRQKHKHMGYCSPILGETNPHYLRNKPTNWVNGITLVEMQADGNFNVISLNIINGKFRYGGVQYGG